MYELHIDRPENFECSVKIEGVASAKATSRIILETENSNLVFYGTIDAAGKCIVPMKNLKEYIQEGTSGKIKLEVIADDTYFCPWTSDFISKLSKKVTVEVAQPTVEKPSVTVQITPKTVVKEEKVEPVKKVVEKKPIKKVQPKKFNINELVEGLKKKGITTQKIKDSQQTQQYLANYLKKKNVNLKESFKQLFSLLEE